MGWCFKRPGWETSWPVMGLGRAVPRNATFLQPGSNSLRDSFPSPALIDWFNFNDGEPLTCSAKPVADLSTTSIPTASASSKGPPFASSSDVCRPSSWSPLAWHDVYTNDSFNSFHLTARVRSELDRQARITILTGPWTRPRLWLDLRHPLHVQGPSLDLQ